MNEILFKQNPNSMFIYNTDTLKIKDVNKEACEKYGYTKKEFLKLTIKDIRPREDIPALLKALEEMNFPRQNTGNIYRHQKKCGEQFFIQITSQAVNELYENCRLVVVHDVTDQIQAEQKVKQAYEELNHHITHSPLALVKWDYNFCIREWSDRAEEISGYTQSEVIGKSPFSFQFFGDNEVVKVKENIRALLEGEHNRNQFETSILHKNGEQMHIKIHSSARRDEKGKLLSVLTLIEDISEQKRVEKWFQMLFETSNDALFIMKDEIILDCNEEAARMFETTKVQLIGDSVIDSSPFLQPDESESGNRAIEIIEQAMQGKPQRFEWRHQTAMGNPIDVEVSITRVTLKGEHYLLSQLRDITEKKARQQEIRTREELFHNLFLKSPAALVMVDKDNKVNMINESFARMFGYTEQELKGKDIDKIIVPEEEYGEAPKMPAVDYTYELFNREVVRHTKQGEKKHVLLSGIPVHIDGEPYAGFGMYIDITDRTQYEEQLEESVKEKQVLLEEIHHRVKNNLAVISSILHLQEFESEDQRIKTVLGDSQMRIKSIALIHEMLYREKSFSSISFNTYIRQLVERIQETFDQGNHNIKVHIEVDQICLNINQAVPCALLLNELLTNAYKHAFKGEESGTISISIGEYDERIFVRISDNGIGMPNDFKNSSGASLGMSLVHTLSEQIEADLEYSDSDGTTIEFSFSKKIKTGSSSLHLN